MAVDPRAEPVRPVDVRTARLEYCSRPSSTVAAPCSPWLAGRPRARRAVGGEREEDAEGDREENGSAPVGRVARGPEREHESAIAKQTVVCACVSGSVNCAAPRVPSATAAATDRPRRPGRGEQHEEEDRGHRRVEVTAKRRLVVRDAGEGVRPPASMPAAGAARRRAKTAYIASAAVIFVTTNASFVPSTVPNAHASGNAPTSFMHPMNQVVPPKRSGSQSGRRP
jgi:hypothetical protein